MLLFVIRVLVNATNFATPFTALVFCNTVLKHFQCYFCKIKVNNCKIKYGRGVGCNGFLGKRGCGIN